MIPAFTHSGLMIACKPRASGDDPGDYEAAIASIK